MTTAVVAGAGFAAGILWFVRALRPRPVGLATILDAVIGDGRGQDAALRTRLAEYGADAVASSPLDSEALRADLAMASVSLQDLVGESIMSAAGLGAVVLAAGVVMTTLGASLPALAVVGACCAAAAGGATIPWLALKRKAAAMRRHFLRVLGTFLELVALGMAGAMGVEGAVGGAMSISDDWAFVRLRESVDAARHRGLAPWVTLAELGEKVGVVELTELAANLGLAGSEGARVRDTLVSKAATLRRRELAAAEAAANATTEKMFLPGVLLLAGFLVFVGYPAVAHVFQTL